MGTPKRHTRFCGIDVGKRRHVACIIDQDGRFVIRSQAFSNEAGGFQRILTRLTEAGGPQRVLVGMEATGHYWYCLRDALVDAGYEVVVINPIQTKQQAKKGIRKSKTDKIDARHIAILVKNGDYSRSVVPNDLAMTCRQLTRLRAALVNQGARIKLLLHARLDPVWPEFETLFTHPLCKTGRQLLVTAPVPADVLALSHDALVALVGKASRGRYGPAQADRIRQSAQDTIGIRRGLHAARISIRSLIAQLESTEPIRKQLEVEIHAVADQLPEYLLTLPGADPLTIVSLFGETDPIDTFSTADQLVAFSGLDTVVFQTGNYEKTTRRRISKRGSPHLRHTLWAMARRASFQEGDLREYYYRRRREGLHHLSAVTATALKLCRVAWRVMTDRRDYLPEPPSHTA